MRQHRTIGAIGTAIVLLVSACSGDAESPKTDSSMAGASVSAEPGSSPASPTPLGGPLETAPCEPLPDLPRNRIVYTYQRNDGTQALHLMKPDGSDRRCLVDTDGPDSYPAWSPDGRWIAFIGGSSDQHDVFVVRADGTHLRQLTDTPELEEEVAWSPDGGRIAYTRSEGDAGPFAIHVMGRTGKGDVRIAKSDDVFGSVELHDWAPDAERLLVWKDRGAGGELWSMDSDGRNHTQLQGAEGGDFGAGATYSPDGRSIVFTADLRGGCLYRSDAMARHLVRLTTGCMAGYEPDWSPDGRRIIYAGGDQGPTDAEVIGSDGTQQRTIVDDGSVAFPAWQPDV